MNVRGRGQMRLVVCVSSFLPFGALGIRDTELALELEKIRYLLSDFWTSLFRTSYLLTKFDRTDIAAGLYQNLAVKKVFLGR